MSQKYIKTQNKNSHNAKSYGKYYAQPVYDQKFIETDEIADFIQTQATLKRSDIKAALDELGAAMKHFLELGQKIRLSGIGIFKVGFSSIGVTKVEDCTAATITSRRVLFQPETERIVVGSAEKDGKVIQKYVNAKTLVKDVAFEETHDNTMNMEPEEDAESGNTGGGSSNTNGSNNTNTGGGTQGGGGNTGGNTGGPDDNGYDPELGDGN
jgi:predicted histone-like DNA-binding protein